jgi:hypothetical protein
VSFLVGEMPVVVQALPVPQVLRALQLLSDPRQWSVPPKLRVPEASTLGETAQLWMHCEKVKWIEEM